jgi:hypothetical protein
MTRTNVSGMLIVLCGLFVAAGGAAAQTSGGQSQRSEASKSINSALTLPRGSVILARLMTDLDSHKCKVGDSIVARTSKAIEAGGQAVLPKGSMLDGHVVYVQPYSKDKGESILGIVFDNATPVGGRAMRLRLVLVALAPKPDKEFDTIITGEGLEYTNVQPPTPPTNNASYGDIHVLSEDDQGTFNLPEDKLGHETVKGVEVSTVFSTKRNVRLTKGMQLALRADM